MANVNQIIPGGVITRKELSDSFDISPMTLAEMDRSGIVVARRVGRRDVYLTDEVIAWIRDRAPKKERKVVSDDQKGRLVRRFSQ